MLKQRVKRVERELHSGPGVGVVRIPVGEGLSVHVLPMSEWGFLRFPPHEVCVAGQLSRSGYTFMYTAEG